MATINLVALNFLFIFAFLSVIFAVNGKKEENTPDLSEMIGGFLVKKFH